VSDVVVRPLADRRLFSLHPEADVTEVSLHRRQVVYLETNLRVELPDRFVGANLGVYWVPGQLEKPWAGPDVLVSTGQPADPEPRVYLVWEDGPIQFVAEVASERTRRTEKRKRERTYQDQLAIPEVLHIDHSRDQLELWRLREGKYVEVRPEGGRLYSQELGVWFGWEEGRRFVRIWTPDGRMLPTPEEERERGVAMEQHAREAEERAREAEERARDAETRAATLEAELERLRRGQG
jgi:Uma2 family endonuclease